MSNPIPIIQGIVKGALEFRAALNQVKANKQQCSRLGSRIDTIVSRLNQLNEADFVSSSSIESLKRLQTCVTDCIHFVEKFGDANWFKRIFANQDHRNEFAELNNQLSHHVDDLHLGLTMDGLFNRENDEADRIADLSDLNQKIDDIATMMDAQHSVQLQHHAHVDEQFSDMKRRLASFRYHVEQNLHRATSPTFAAVVDAEESRFLNIPYNDLHIEKRVGQGGFADVFQGIWISQQHPVAIKVLRSDHLNKIVKEDFVREISIMYNIRFDNILNVLGACIEPDYYALIVEYMAFGSLFDVLRAEETIQLLWSDRWSISLQMAKGINYLHQWKPQPIIHRDIKSLNFLVDRGINGFLVKVGDFGLAKVRRECSKQSYTTEQMYSATTLQWKAPELFQESNQHTTQSDIFALGVVFWEVATRCVPYENLDDATITLLVISSQRLHIPDNIPVEYADMITRTWTEEPTERPTCLELIKQINEVKKLYESSPMDIVEKDEESILSDHKLDETQDLEDPSHVKSVVRDDQLATQPVVLSTVTLENSFTASIQHPDDPHLNPFASYPPYSIYPNSFSRGLIDEIDSSNTNNNQTTRSSIFTEPITPISARTDFLINLILSQDIWDENVVPDHLKQGTSPTKDFQRSMVTKNLHENNCISTTYKTIRFHDAASCGFAGKPVTVGYQGFKWKNTECMSINTALSGKEKYLPSFIHGEYIIHARDTNYISISPSEKGRLFHIQSLQARVPSNIALLELVGHCSDSKNNYSKLFILTCNEPQTIELYWTNINKLKLITKSTPDYEKSIVIISSISLALLEKK